MSESNTEAIRETQKKYCSRAMFLAICAAVVLIAFGFKPSAKGLVLGTLFSILNFIIMGRTLPMRLHRQKGKTLAICLGSLWMRYALMAVPLILSLKLEQFNIAGSAVGLFMVQSAILSDRLFSRATDAFKLQNSVPPET